MEKPSPGFLSINIGFRRRGWNPNRGFNFKIIVLYKKDANGLKDSGSQNQIFANEMLSVMLHGSIKKILSGLMVRKWTWT